MKLLTYCTGFALVALLVAAPSSKKDDELVITRDLYFDDSVKYTGEHEIVNILVPLNSLNFDESGSSESESQEEDSATILFFVEADIQSDGKRIDRGLYVFRDGKAKKLLDNGRDAAASGDESKSAFFGAQDGLYVYNYTTNSADKYGPITDSIIAIAKEKAGDVIYILTEDREVYKISNNGETKVKLDDVVNAKEIVLDYSDNLYFFSDDNKPYVRTADGVKKVDGLPEDLTDVKLIKPPFILDDSVPFVVGNKIYILYSNGTSEVSDIEFQSVAKPSAYAPEATLVQYYATNKKIYELNILKLMLKADAAFSGYLDSKASEIRTLASKTKSEASRTKAQPKL